MKYDRINIIKLKNGGYMKFILSIILVFLISFIVMTSIYVLLIKFNFIKKKKIEKVFRLVFVYTIFITLVYIYQYIFI
ncbi:hypothetical protein HMPREF1871_00233 [Gemelliphila asaccharolytica]|uniref:Uncharacterized protein n=1 Tax=Gemelliphila asaccharolytica TaxID=502393 RepID=A0ABR5TN08_9BACL|nr:hypothetical protein HMPREF1871_00233 [Gemella asaccharolytica]